jgi:TonB family protein
MRVAESWILAYLVNGLWQIPLLFAAGWLTARVLRPLGAVAEHRVWVSTLVLQSVLPALAAFPWKWPPLLLLTFPDRSAGAQVRIITGPGSGVGQFPIPQGLLTVAALLYVCVVGYGIARFLWRTLSLAGLRRDAVPLALEGESAQFWARCVQRFGVTGASPATSDRIFGPVTLGMKRKLLLLPPSMAANLNDADFSTVIAHEFAHMYRHDFSKNLLYEGLSLPILYHPVLGRTRAHLRESREMICDQIAASMTGSLEYGQSLLRLAASLVKGRFTQRPHTIGIFDTNTFERRIMNLTETRPSIKNSRRLATVVACAAVTLAACASAVALGLHGNAAPQVAASDNSSRPKQLSIREDVMAGNLINRVIPVYPEEAKKAKIEGTVLLDAIISKEGNVENLRVVSGPKELQQSAVDAVRQWKYKPYLLNGDPIEVKTTVKLVYTL